MGASSNLLLSLLLSVILLSGIASFQPFAFADDEPEEDDVPKTLAEECEEELDDDDIDLEGLFCLAILSIQNMLDMVKADVDDLLAQITSNDSDIADHEIRISNLESGPPTDSLIIVGFDARDVDALEAHNGLTMNSLTAGPSTGNPEGKNIDERIAIYVQNIGLDELILSEVKLGGTVYVYDSPPALTLSQWDSTVDLVKGEYALMFDEIGIFSQDTPIITDGDTVTIIIDLNDNFAVDQSTQLKITTENGLVISQTIIMGQTDGFLPPPPSECLVGFVLVDGVCVLLPPGVIDGQITNLFAVDSGFGIRLTFNIESNLVLGVLCMDAFDQSGARTSGICFLTDNNGNRNNLPVENHLEEFPFQVFTVKLSVDGTGEILDEAQFNWTGL